ncbi:MAG: hypothetical protein V3T05_03435 [Myxococcota bacterium]
MPQTVFWLRLPQAPTARISLVDAWQKNGHLNCRVPRGALSDRLGTRRALTVSMAVILAGRLILVISPNGSGETMIAGLAWSAIIVMGFGEGVIQPALYAGVKEYSDKRSATIDHGERLPVCHHEPRHRRR